MKKTFWNKLTARGTRGKTRCAAAVLALAMTFSMGAPLALAAQPEESTAAVTETVSAQQETAMPTLQTETPELAAQDPEAPPVQATEAEENSTNQHTPENSVVLTPEEIRAALDAGAMDAAEAQCIDLSDENGFFSWLLNFLFGWLGKDESQPEPAYSGWRTSGGKTYYYSQTTNKPVTGIQCIDNKLYYFNADGVLENGKTFGVDVSKYQKNIDWNQIKKAGVSFVIVRIGYRGYGSGALVEDSTYRRNIQGAINAGLRVGVYFYSQAINEAEAVEEASMVLSLVSGYSLPLGVYYDTESVGGGRANALSAAERTACAVAFCETIRSAGYSAGVYSYASWFYNALNFANISKYNIWIAQYRDTLSFSYKHNIWQYTGSGSVKGISKPVDMNIG